MPTKKYPSDGTCLFCMEQFDPPDLTDEHVVPEGIGGRYVLVKGSCKACAHESNDLYENKAINGDFQLPRLLLGIKGKGKFGGMPRDLRHLPAVYAGDRTAGGEGERLLDFAIEDYPNRFHLPVYQPAGILAGVDRGGALAKFAMRQYNLGAPGLLNVTVKQPLINGPLAQTLAKIAYCFAIGELGKDGFDGAEIRDLLKGRRGDLYNLVGSSAREESLPSITLHGLYMRERCGLVIVLIDLFACCHNGKTRPYEVVVGRRQGAGRLRPA